MIIYTKPEDFMTQKEKNRMILRNAFKNEKREFLLNFFNNPVLFWKKVYGKLYGIWFMWKIGIPFKDLFRPPF